MITSFRSFFFLFLMAALANPLQGLAQEEISCKVIVNNEQGEPLIYATVALKFNEEIKSGGYTDENGTVNLKIKEGQKYSIVISYVGYQTSEKIFESTKEVCENTYILKPDLQSLDQIDITAMKKVITRDKDRIIMNINGDNSLGLNAQEILRKAPGVQIVRDDIQLLGKNIRVEVNGRSVAFTGNELLNFLKNQNSTKILKIELVTNPSARYDADFEGRVINIITEDFNEGYTVNFSGDLTQRSKDLSNWAGANFHLYKNKFSIYTGITNSVTKSRELSLSEQLLKSGTGITKLISDNENKYDRKYIQYQSGMDWYFSEKSILGFRLEGSVMKNEGDLIGQSLIFKHSSLDSLTNIDDKKIEEDNRLNMNLNYRIELDSLGTYLNVDLDYGQTSSDFINRQIVSGQKPEAENINQRNISQSVEGNNSFFGIKSDFYKTFSNLDFEAGLHFATSNISQSLAESSQIIQEEDEFRHLEYDENIYATYADFSGEFSGFEIGVGLRGELTIYRGRENFENLNVSNQYFHLFPEISIGKTLNKKHFLNFSWEKNIKRPRFDQLIPFKDYRDAFSYYLGNPDLLPFLPNDFELYYSYNNNLWTNIIYSFANNRILEYERLLPGTLVREGVVENNGRYDKLQLGIGLNKKVYTWLFITSNFRYSIGEEEAFINQNEESFDYNAYTFFISPNFSFKKLTINPNFYYSSDVYYGVSKRLNFSYFNLGVRYEIIPDMELSLTGRDIFLGGISRSESNYGDIEVFSRNNWDSRQLILGLNYFFGNTSTKSKRSRASTANESNINRL